MQFPTSKLPHLGTTIFTTMTQLASKYKAINLSQGFPNFQTDPELLALSHEAFLQNHNQYAPLVGYLPLVEAILDKTNTLYKSDYTQDELCVTAGATQGIFTIISAMIKPGDEVIVLKPAYDCYEPAIQLNGGIPVLIELKAPHYQVDWDEVKVAITAKTRMIIINSPHNPTGMVFAEADMQALSQLVENTDILILSDEVYEHMTFDGRKHLSVAAYPTLKERSFITASFGKTFHVTGWKMGYVLAPQKLMKEFKKIHQYLIFCVNHPLQVAISEYIKKEEKYLNLPTFYQEKRDYFLSLMKESRFKFIPAQGTYFQLLDYSLISDENDIDFTHRLITAYGLAAIPVSVFNKDKICRKKIRICFAKDNQTLEAAASVMNSVS